MKDANAPLAQWLSATRSFGGQVAVDAVDLQIGRGEIVALLGPNGAGKSTLVDLLTGLRVPTSGAVRLFDSVPADRRARARLGVMLQDTTGPAGLTVRETITLGRRLYPRTWTAERLLAVAQLEHRAGARVGELSLGERQRVALALALVGDPELLVLDEPTASLDVASRRDLWTVLREFATEGRAIVLATHQLREAQQLATRVVLLDHGRKVADGPTAEIVGRLRTRRLRMRTDAPRDWLSSVAEVTRVGLTADGCVDVVTECPEDVLARTFARGYRVAELSCVPADLEDVFLAITNHGLGAA